MSLPRLPIIYMEDSNLSANTCQLLTKQKYTDTSLKWRAFTLELKAVPHSCRQTVSFVEGKSSQVLVCSFCIFCSESRGQVFAEVHILHAKYV